MLCVLLKWYGTRGSTLKLNGIRVSVSPLAATYRMERPLWEDSDKTDLFGSRGGHDLMDYVVSATATKATTTNPRFESNTPFTNANTTSIARVGWHFDRAVYFDNRE